MHLTEGEMESHLCRMDFVNKNQEIHPSIRTRIGCFGKGEEYSPFSDPLPSVSKSCTLLERCILMGEGPLWHGDSSVPGDTGIPLSFTAGSLPLFYIWHGSKSTFDKMKYHTIVAIPHLRGRKIVMFLPAEAWLLSSGISFVAAYG